MMSGTQATGRPACSPAGGDVTPRASRAAFTLVEVMIAIALVMVLMLGVAQVFQMTSQTISSGQALQTVTRDARAAETTLSFDARSILTGDNQPALVIWSQRHWAFLDVAAQISDLDGDPSTVDINGNGIEGEVGVPGERLSPALYNARNHRIDMIAFVATGHYARQTSPDNSSLTGPGGTTANEALISYGHLLIDRLRDPADPAPGPLSPPHGYARDWKLGRTAILLDPHPSTPGVATGTAALDPLRFDSPTTASGYTLGSSRFDVARTSASDYAVKVRGTGDWWRRAVAFRFEAEPHPQPPYDEAAIARTVPVFLNNCTSIIVEYAGDYLFQYDRGDHPTEPHLWGATSSVWNRADNSGTDGEIDYFYDPGGSAATLSSKKKIRWYGLPRDINGNGAIAADDVVPLRDIWNHTRQGMIDNGEPDPGPQSPFERDPAGVENMPPAHGVRFVDQKAFDNEPSSGLGYADIDNGMQRDEAYYCAWGPRDRKPALLRITLRIDDPNGRLPEGLWFQYVLSLPGS